jgi:hypothetical protein
MAMRDAARNEGGAAGVMLGAGMGTGLSAMASGATAPDASEGSFSRLRKLKGLLDEKLITETEFEAKKRDILKDL